MNDFKAPFDEDMLHAWVDDQLDKTDKKIVEKWLHENPTEAARWQDYRDQNQQLKKLYNNFVEEPVPAHLKPAEINTVKSRSTLRQLTAIAATLVIGIATGWFSNSYLVANTNPNPFQITDMPNMAMKAHTIYAAEVLHPVEVTAKQEAHLITWLSKRLGQSINAPGLDEFGFNLLGGRLLPGNDGPAAQFMYENTEGNRLTLFVVENPDNKDTAFRFQKADDISSFYWIDGPLGYVLTGDVGRSELLEASNVVYETYSNSKLPLE